VGSDQSTVRYNPSHQSLSLGVASELGAAIDAELLIDVVEMDLDRSLADEEFLADLHVAQSGRHLNSGLIIPCFPPGQIHLGSDSFIKKHAHENKKANRNPPRAASGLKTISAADL
jgi:hypothetical protein